MKTKNLKKFMMIILALTAFMLVLGLSGNVKAAVDEPNRKIAPDFEESFVNAIYEKYDLTEDTFTWEWASEQTRLDLSNMSIGGIDKGGTGESVLTTYFSSLEVLDVSNNELKGLPNLPNTLKELYCQNNSIVGLPNLTPVLTDLNCSNNAITALPDLSPVLKTLNVSNNEIVALPNLSPVLTDLNCSNNAITALPDLSPVLKTLNCAENKLTALPLMPDGLTALDCSGNSIEWLGTPVPGHEKGTFPATLVDIKASDNQIKAVGPLPEGLKTLDVENNGLTKVPVLPENLKELNIKGNSGITSISAKQLPQGLILSTDLLKGNDGNYYIESELPEDDNTGTEDPKDNEDKELDEEPKTGETEYIVLASAVAMITLAGIVVLKSRK